MSGNEQQTFLGGPDANRAPAPTQPKTDVVRSGSRKLAVLRQIRLNDPKGVDVHELRQRMVLGKSQLLGIVAELHDDGYIEAVPGRDPAPWRLTEKGKRRVK